MKNVLQLLLVLSLSLFAGIGENNIPIPSSFTVKHLGHLSDNIFEFTWVFTHSDSLKGFRITAESIATFDVGISDTAQFSQATLKEELYGAGWVEHEKRIVYYVQAIYEIDGNTNYSNPSDTASALFSQAVSNQVKPTTKSIVSVINNSKELSVVSPLKVKGLHLISAKGQILRASVEAGVTTLNTEGITPGVYFLNINTASQQLSQKVMIQ